MHYDTESWLLFGRRAGSRGEHLLQRREAADH